MIIGELLARFASSSELSVLAPETRRYYMSGIRNIEKSTSAYHADVSFGERAAKIAIDELFGGMSCGSAYQALATISAALTWGERKGYVERNFMRGTKRPVYGSHPAVTEEELNKLINSKHSNKYLNAIIVAAATTAQRRSDLILARVDQYKNGILTFKQNKTGVVVPYPVCSTLKPHLDMLDQERPADFKWLFFREYKDFPLHAMNKVAWTDDSLTNHWCRLREKEDVHKPFHGLRKLRAIQIAESGGTVPEIMALLGHKSPGMATHYVKEASKGRLISSALERLK